MSYPEQARLLGLRLHNLRAWAVANGYTARSPISVFIDVTGIGRATFDLLRESIPSSHVKITAVTLTAGSEATRKGHELHLPKMELVDKLRLLMEERRIEVPPTSKEYRALTSELRTFLGTKVAANTVTTGAKAGRHDDLVVALGLAIYGADAPTAVTHIRDGDFSGGPRRNLGPVIRPLRDGDPTLTPVRRAYAGIIYADNAGNLVHRPTR